MTEEIIGAVTLNLEKYAGVDAYSDGDIEDYLLEIVKENGDIDYTETILKNASWPVLYHLSGMRENIVSWYPFQEDDEVLEIGAGCGAVTGALIRSCKSVTALDLSLRRCRINAHRHNTASNLNIIVSSFMDALPLLHQKYSCVTLIGVLEYSKLYIGGQEPFVRFLSHVKGLLKPGGKVLIAIENRLGMKYFAGTQEDHLGVPMRGIEGYQKTDNVQTFSRKELQSICEQAGFEQLKFYYPYPDYKFPDVIYSDEYLPQRGELTRNTRNFDSDRYVLFNESAAFDGIIDAGLFQEFSNSFFVEAKGG